MTAAPTEFDVSARRREIAWALYDWGNSAFATTVMAGFFPLFFRQYWSAGTDATIPTFRLGLANSGAGVLVAVLSPVLGAVADRGGSRKRMLAAFTLLGALATAALSVVARGDWMTAIVLYALASIGFAGGMNFYDALLVGVAKPSDSDRVSALGYAAGYLGGGLLFAVNVAMSLSPATFGFGSAATAVRVSFVLVGAWWVLFTVPLLVAVPEPHVERAGGGPRVRDALREIGATLRNLRGHRNVAWFLAAYWLYIDGVDTVIRMAVDYGLALGFPTTTLITALLVTQFVGFPAAIAYGRVAARVGTRRAIFAGIAAYAAITVWGSMMRRPWEFMVLAVCVGCVQGGVQALSRSLYARLIPPERAGEFFGFYNMLGKFAVVIGPALMGTVGWVTHSVRASILSVLVLFAAGAWALTHVGERGRS